MQQPEPPKLPPMPQASPPPSPLPSAPVQPQKAQKAAGGNRLQKMVTVLASTGFTFVAVVSIAELTLRPELKPTTILATIEAQTELGVINQKMGATPGLKPMTEGEYREKIAEAERNGQAKAEIVFQRQLAAVQADKERVVGAYQALYQRTNIIAQAGVQMEATAQQFRQRLIEQTNGGRAVVISVLDGLCALGDATSCESAREARAGMMRESGELTEGDLARKVAELMAGIPDPASLVADADARQNGRPAIQQ